MTENEMVGWHHQPSGQEFEQAPGDGKGREAWCAQSMGCKESDMTEQLNNKKILMPALLIRTLGPKYQM